MNWEKESVAVNKQLLKRNYEHETSLKGTNGESQITLRALVPPKTKAFFESELSSLNSRGAYHLTENVGNSGWKVNG